MKRNKINSKSGQICGLAVVLLAVGLSACQDVLKETPNSYYDSAKIFESTDNAQLGLNGVYNALTGTMHYGQEEMAMPTSDDMYFINGTNSDGSRRDISHYQLFTSNSWVKDLWTAKYMGIERANSIIEGVRGMDDYVAGNAEALRIEGEALFLRAMLSLDLVKYWGDVPYKASPTAFETAYLPKTKKELIYDQIMADLDLAKTRMSWATTGTNTERATQGAARALLMRAYLLRAGYALDSETGVISCPDDATRTIYFKAVASEWEAFETNGFHGFNNSYTQLWKNYCQEIVDPKESIFEIALYTADGGKTTAGTYATYIGPIISANSSYGRANGFFRVLPEWYAYYHTSDSVRRDINMCHYTIDADGNEVTANKKTYYPGKWRRNWCTGTVKDPNNTDVNFVFLRYADVVLMAAEAYNELGNSPKAIELINMVRARAGALQWDDATAGATYNDLYKAPQVADLDYIDDGDMKGKVRTALYWERGFELCYEATRKYDLLRWGILPEALQLHKNTIYGSGYKAPTNFVSGKHELFPIPLAEMQVNNLLENKNNPGY